MSENEQQGSEGGRPPVSQRPRRDDGSFMTNKEYDEFIKSQQLERAESRNKESNSHLIESNKALMKGTRFTEGYFEGMDVMQINKFLTNWHAKNDSSESETTSNTPILGTPVGSGKTTYGIDPFISIDPKRKEINFEAPASLVFATHPNKNEAKKQWSEAR